MKNNTTKQIAARLKTTAAEEGSAEPPKPVAKPNDGARKFVNGKGWCTFKHGRGWVPDKKPTTAKKTTASKRVRVTAAPAHHPLEGAFDKVVATFESKLGEPTEREKTPGFGTNEIMYTSATWDIRSNKGEKPIFNVTLDHKDSLVIFTYASDVVKTTASGTTAKDAAQAFKDDAAKALSYSESKKRDVRADNENLRSIVGILNTIK